MFTCVAPVVCQAPNPPLTTCTEVTYPIAQWQTAQSLDQLVADNLASFTDVDQTWYVILIFNLIQLAIARPIFMRHRHAQVSFMHGTYCV